MVNEIRGLWSTDAPLPLHLYDSHRGVLNRLTDEARRFVAAGMTDSHDVQVVELSVYIDGVLWSYKPAPEIFGKDR